MRNRAAAWIALLLFLLLPFIGDQRAFQRRMAEFNPDLKGWLATSAQVASDPTAPLYEHYSGFYLYPPFFLVLITPLTWLPVPVAAVAFVTLKWAALLASLHLAWRLCTPRGEDAPPLVVLGSLFLTWRFVDSDLAYGNINLFLLLAILAATACLARGRDVLAGVLVGFAACVKATPALLLVYFVYRRRWRTLLGAAAAGVLALAVVPSLAYGWDANLQLHQAWYDAVVARFLSAGAVRSEHSNQALVAIFNRLLGDHPAVFRKDGNHVYLTLVMLPDWARALLRWTCAAAVMAGVAWTCRRSPRAARPPLADAAEVSLVLVAMLLLSGITWKAHAVLLLLPVSVTLTYAADARHPPAPRRTAGRLLLAYCALVLLTTDVITPTGAKLAEGVGLIAAAIIVLGVAAAVVHRAITGPAETVCTGERPGV